MPTFKRIVNYVTKNAKRGAIVLTIGALPVACSDNNEPDPIQERIDLLTSQKPAQEKAVRDAVQPAKFNPDNVSSYFEMVANRNKMSEAKNIADSAHKFVIMVEDMRNENGTPLPYNNNTISNLDNASKTYIATIEEIALLQKQR